jgi:D-alanyl-D-alanine endopeptidase (penicillin-binding protein 7)
MPLFLAPRASSPIHFFAVEVRARAIGSAVLVAVTVTATALAPAAEARTKTRHGQKSHKKHVMLERHVVAVRGGLPNVQAQGALVLDEAGHEVYARRADQERPIASISKLAATLAVVDHGLDLDELTTITPGDVEVAKGGARSRLLEGMTVSNRDLLHAALMGSDNRAIPALGRAVKLSPAQLTAAMNTKARALGLKHTRFREPTGLSTENVSTPRETIEMLKAVIAQPVLAAITRRAEYDAHPVSRPPIRYVNTDHMAARGNVEVIGGKTGYNDDARYCLVVATKIDGRGYFMSFLANEGKLTRFGDVARVADWIVARKPKAGAASAVANNAAPPPGPPVALPVGVAAPPPAPAPTANP